MNTSIMRFLAGCAVLILLEVQDLRADVKPNALCSENAVLQQKLPVPIWGTASDGETVTVEFQKQKLVTVATNGQWKVVLKPLRAGGPFTLKITGHNTLVFTNILVGEVWICSGQSNMQWGLGASENAQAAITNSADPMLRLYTVPLRPADQPQTELGGGWTAAGPSTVPNFSAVGYYFGRDLRRARKVPVGLINTSWGGTIIETWTSRAEYESHPELGQNLDDFEQAMKRYEETLARYRQDEPTLRARHEEAAAKAKQEGKPPPPAPQPPVSPARNPNFSCRLYNGMIAPLQPFGIAGAIWYQGESNAGNASRYRSLLPALIESWRRSWGQGDFPFLIVQLPPCGPATGPSPWAELREAQWKTSQSVPRAGLAVITDAGDCGNLHPRRKEPVGTRLALAARAIAYGERIEYSGPQYRSMKIERNRIALSFTHLGGGLVAKDGPLRGFTIAGADQKFVAANAEIRGNQVLVWSDEVEQPVAARYGWADCPSVNLFNQKGLPATPFRTDRHP